MNPAGFLYAGYALRDCIKIQRIHVHRSRYEEFLARFVAATKAGR